MITDVTVNISSAGAEVSSTDYGLILIISDDKVQAYTEYDLSGGIAASGIATDYPIGTDTYKKALAVASQKPSPSKIAVVGCSTTAIDPEDIITILDEMFVTHDSFFRVLTTYDVDATKLALAQWAVQKNKFPYIQYNDITFTSDYSTIGARVHLHKTVNEFADAAEAGFFASLVPGTTIPKFREYVGLTPQTFTTAEKAFIKSNNLAHYEKVTGLNMERSSRATNWSSSSPRYIDDLESRVYIATEMQNKLLTQMVNSPKLGGDTNGVQVIGGTIATILETAYQLGIIATLEGKGDYSVNIKSASFNKVTRSWDNVTYKYEYLHGTESITINGVVK